jgi:hypothetical protein
MWPRTPQVWRCAENLVSFLFAIQQLTAVAVQSSELLRFLWRCTQPTGQTNTLHVIPGRTFVSHRDNLSPKCGLHVADVIERAVSAQGKRLDQGTLRPAIVTNQLNLEQPLMRTATRKPQPPRRCHRLGRSQQVSHHKTGPRKMEDWRIT